ncbi:unnamed protein product [Bursaphelenchus okinawaensis]|uniref:Band 7 domain-containing protein n=1 Tax=Bursaphelenchus okinawaensis TaxID=465554 RepID=A0A811KSU4_9BILA|nr:unnamed protein product [Bursaphelenchus okinawaensis]CAG9111770.1 unnamed protein product [Bursaphelenchus okinawaensis]
MFNTTAILEFFGFDGKEETLRSTINENFYKSNFTYNTDFDLSNQYLSIHEDFSNLKQQPPTDEVHARSSVADAILYKVFVCLSAVLLAVTLPFSLIFCLKFVASYETLVVLRLGRTHKVHESGSILVLPFIDKVHRIDVRPKNVELPELSVITADKGIVSVKVVVCYQVTNPFALVCTIKDKDDVVKEVAQTTLHNKITKSTVADITHPRSLDRIMEQVNGDLKEFVNDTGITLTDVKVLNAKVVKPGDNNTFNTFTQIMKSDAGKHMFGMIGEVMKEALGHDILGMATKNAAQPNATTINIPQAGPSAKHTVFNEIINKISLCCDSILVSKVGKRYRIHCDCGGYVETADLNLSEGTGSVSTNPNQDFNPNVTFSLSIKVLNDLINGDMSPWSAYLNGHVKLEGSVDDAMSLKHLSERARALKLKQ